MSMMPPRGVLRIERRLIHLSAWNRYSRKFDIPALCVAPCLCGRNSYVEIKGSWPCLHKTLYGAGRWNRANFALTEFYEVRVYGVLGSSLTVRLLNAQETVVL